jgi:hypothetical protein
MNHTDRPAPTREEEESERDGRREGRMRTPAVTETPEASTASTASKALPTHFYLRGGLRGLWRGKTRKSGKSQKRGNFPLSLSFNGRRNALSLLRCILLLLLPAHLPIGHTQPARSQ